MSPVPSAGLAAGRGLAVAREQPQVAPQTLGEELDAGGVEDRADAEGERRQWHRREHHHADRDGDEAEAGFKAFEDLAGGADCGPGANRAGGDRRRMIARR